MCAHVFLECDEIGTVYPDVLDLTRAGLWQERLLCPHCYRQPASGFLRSTFEEVQGVGMTAEDVETEAGPEYP